MTIYIVIFCILMCGSLISTNKKKALIISGFLLLLLSVFCGFRDTAGADSPNYIDYFYNNTSIFPVFDFSMMQYAESGFYVVSILLKSIWNNHTFYFTIIALATLIFYYKSISKFSLYPLISILVYYVRFLPFREMNQIRGALAIAIIIHALIFLANGNRRRFIIIVLLTSLIHFSSLIVLPFAFIYNIKLSIKRLIRLIIISYFAGAFFMYGLRSVLLGTENIVMLTYIGDSGLGITNPMVYYQVSLCLIFAWKHEILERIQPYYRLILNAYVYSTVILLLCMGLGVIGGRLSTIFATCEIFILPALIKIFRQRYVGRGIVTSIIILIFYMNYVRMMQEYSLWQYPSII